MTPARCLALAAVLVVAAPAARAEAQGVELAAAAVVIPPSVVGLIFDVVLMSTLLPHGVAQRRHAITAMVFGGISFTAGGFGLALAAAVPGAPTGWVGLSVLGTVVGVATLVLSGYGLSRSGDEPEPQPEPEPPLLGPPGPSTPLPPMLFYLPLRLKL